MNTVYKGIKLWYIRAEQWLKKNTFLSLLQQNCKCQRSMIDGDSSSSGIVT